MSHCTLQSGIEARDENRWEAIQRAADLDAAIDERAAEIAAEIAADARRLSGFLTRGDIALHEIVTVDAEGKCRTGEELVALAVAEASRVPLTPTHPLMTLLDAIRRELRASADVRERAESDVLSGRSIDD